MLVPYSRRGDIERTRTSSVSPGRAPSIAIGPVMTCTPGPRSDGGGPAGGGTTAGQAATGPKTIHLAVDASYRPVRTRIDTGAHEILLIAEGGRLAVVRDRTSVQVTCGPETQLVGEPDNGVVGHPALAVPVGRYGATEEVEVEVGALDLQLPQVGLEPVQPEAGRRQFLLPKGRRRVQDHAHVRLGRDQALLEVGLHRADEVPRGGLVRKGRRAVCLGCELWF